MAKRRWSVPASMQGKRLWPLGHPFTPVTAERPKPMRGPSLWQQGKGLVRRGWAWLRLLGVDREVDAKMVERSKMRRLERLAVQREQMAWADWYAADGMKLDEELAVLRRRQRILENEARGE